MRDVLRSAADLIRSHPRALVAGAAVMAVIDTVIAVLTPESSTNIVSTVVSIAVIYVAMRTVLGAEGLIDREGAFSAYFGASLLSGIGIVVGLIFLVVPGLYLMARWSLAPAMILAQGHRATDGLRASWRVTRPIAWKLLILWFLYYFAYIVIIVLIAAPTGYRAMEGMVARDGQLHPALSFILSFIINLGIVATAYLSVAVFRQVFVGGSRLQDVFA